MRVKSIILISMGSMFSLVSNVYASEWLIGEGLIFPSLAQGKSQCFEYKGGNDLPIKVATEEISKVITDYKSAQSSVGIEASANFSFAGFSGGASMGMSSKPNLVSRISETYTL